MDWDPLVTDPREDKLPQWAQQLLRDSRAQTAQARASTAPPAAGGPSSIGANIYSRGSVTRTPIADGSEITFDLADGSAIGVAAAGTGTGIHVYLRTTGGITVTPVDGSGIVVTARPRERNRR